MWQEKAKHCPMCRELLVLIQVRGRPRRRCASCGFVLYSNPASAAAGVVLNPLREVLLVRRAIEPFRGYWALPAGYQEIDEHPRETVVREIREEAGIEARVAGLLDLLFIPDDPRRPANVAVFLCAAEACQPAPGVEESEARFFPLDGLPDDIGFDNYERILGRLQRPEGYPGAPWDELGRLWAGRGNEP